MIDAIADVASDKDAAWFSQHPGRHTRVREFVPGELPISMPMGDGIAVTVVRQVRPGVRMRLPVYVGRMPADTETEAKRLLLIALGRA